MVLAKIVDFCEFVLEMLPNVVAFEALRLSCGKKDRVFENCVVLLGSLVPVAHFNARHIPVERGDFAWENFEHIVALVEVDYRVVSDCEVLINRDGSCGMNMV